MTKKKVRRRSVCHRCLLHLDLGSMALHAELLFGE